MSAISSPARRARRRQRATEIVLVTCVECESRFEVSRRTYREHTAGCIPFRCSLCQPLRQADVALTPKERVRYVRFWLRKFPGAELDYVLGGIFGQGAMSIPARERRAELIASAAPAKR